MGSNRNVSEDSLPMHDFTQKWAGPFLRTTNMPREQQANMDADMDAALVAHRAGIAGDDFPWGAKNPRWILLLPCLERRFPTMKFVHVVRDGRDIAFSGNQNQLRCYGNIILPDDMRNAPTPVRSVAFWARTNTDAYYFGMKSMIGRYLVVRFEDLISQPRTEVQRILRFLGVSDIEPEKLINEVSDPGTVGRWLSKELELRRAVAAAGRDALSLFGYI